MADFNPKDLEDLAGKLFSAGAPLVATALGGPAAGAVVAAIMPQIAEVLGLAPDAQPAAVAAAVAADPQAGEKLAALEADMQKTALAFAQLQVDQNNAELAADKGPVWVNFFYGGWRPAAGWMSGPVFLFYLMMIGLFDNLGWLKNPATPTGFLAWMATIIVLPIFLGLAGFRTYERKSGVALDSLPLRPRGK